MRSRRRLPLLLASLLILPALHAGALSAVIAAGGQRAAAASQAGAAVTIGLRALDERGEPVLDLTAGEVTLEVDGRAQQVRSLELVDLTAVRGTRSRLSTPFATNTASADGRDILLLLDDESLAAGREQSFHAAVQKLLTGVSLEDRIRLDTVRNLDNVPSASGHDSVRDAVAATRGRARIAETREELSCRTRMALYALDASFRSVGAGGSPASIVFFSTSLLPPSEAAIEIGAASQLCEVRLEDFNRIVSLARATPADFYVVHMADGVQAGTTLDMEAGLQSLAGSTGGEFIRVTAGNEAAIGRIARETSAFYRATFEPEGVDQRQVHRVEVKVNRRNVTVRARRDLLQRERVSDAAAKSPAPRDMLRMARVYRDLPLRVAAYSSRNAADGTIKVTVAFESADPESKIAEAVVGLFDDKGKLTAQWTARAGELSRAPAVAALVVSPGTYRLRLVARNGRGMGGTVDADIWAGLASAGAVQLSGLGLGSAKGGSLAPALQFDDEQAAVGYLEVYGAPKSAAVSVAMDVTTSDDVPAVVAAPATVNTASDDAGVRLVIGVIPIASLPPGDYLVRAAVSVNGRPVGRAVRTLRKVGR